MHARAGPAHDSDNADASGLELPLLDGVQQKLLGRSRTDDDVVRDYRCVCTSVSVSGMLILLPVS